MTSILTKLEQKTKQIDFMGDKITLVQLPMIALIKMEVIAKQVKDTDALMANLDMIVLCCTYGVKEFAGQEDLIRNATAEVFRELSLVAQQVLDFSNVSAVDTPKKSAKGK